MNWRIDARARMWLTGACVLLLASTVVGEARLDVTTDKSRYAPGQPVQVYVTLPAEVGDARELDWRVEHLGREVHREARRILADDSPTGPVTLTWTPPADDYRGYRVVVATRDGQGRESGHGATAVDVSSDWRRFPRYGYVSRFDDRVRPQQVIDALNRYHLNGLQFYDWMWKHHVPYSPDPRWPDIANRTVDRRILVDLLTRARDRNMTTMAYNLAYGGYDDCYTDGSGVRREWGVFKKPGASLESQDHHELPHGWATRKLLQFNPASDGWRRYIVDQHLAVFRELPFDGWHVDTLGDRGRLFDADGRPVVLKEHFAPFVNFAADQLRRPIVMNSVGTYGQSELAASAAVDFVYSELWDDAHTDDHGDLLTLMRDIRRRTDKAVVFPAYMQRGLAERTRDRRPFNAPSVRLANAAIHAVGASHLELGDDEQMLHGEYFPSRKLFMDDPLKAATRDLYDFVVAYQNLLRDRDVTLLDRASVRIDGHRVSETGDRGTIWTIASRRGQTPVLHLINLSSVPSTRWRDNDGTYPPPPVLEDLTVTLHLDPPPHGQVLRAASPDQDHGHPQTLTFTTAPDTSSIRFRLPRLEYWTVIWLGP